MIVKNMKFSRCSNFVIPSVNKYCKQYRISTRTKSKSGCDPHEKPDPDSKKIILEFTGIRT